MAFGGEYLFPEKWKVINDTPVDGQLSKTELNRRGAVEFHSKFYPADDWKAHAARNRSSNVFEKMERCRLDPFDPTLTNQGFPANCDPGTLGADDPGFRERSAAEYQANRAAARSNRQPNVRDWKTPLDESYGLRQTSITGAPKELDLGATMVTDAQIHGSGSFADAPKHPGPYAPGEIFAEAVGNTKKADYKPSWQGWDAAGARDTYLSTRKVAQMNRYQNDTPCWARPEWMRTKN